MPADAIAAASAEEWFSELRLPRDEKRRAAKLGKTAMELTEQLQREEQRYNELAKLDPTEPTLNDAELANAEDVELAWATAVAIRYSQIRQTRGRLRALRDVASQSLG